jgi:GNAT superfamily N-acetyltransferase
MRRSAFSRHVPQAVYWPCQHEMVRQLLELGQTIVACDPQDPAHLYGCVTFQPAAAAIVHWLYVKGDYRRLGLARALVTAAVGDRRPILCTQAPELFNRRELVERHELVYCPYLLLGIAPAAAREGTQGIR